MTWIGSVPRTGKANPSLKTIYRLSGLFHRCMNRVSVTRISQSVGNRLSSFEEQSGLPWHLPNGERRILRDTLIHSYYITYVRSF